MSYSLGADMTFAPVAVGPHYSCPAGTVPYFDQTVGALCRNAYGGIVDPVASSPTSVPTLRPVAAGFGFGTIALVAAGIFGLTLMMKRK
jgi:hypothetical protein